MSDATLTSLIAELRAAIGDDARTPRLVRTIHGLGYAFCSDVVSETASPTREPDRGRSYRIILGEREIALSRGSTFSDDLRKQLPRV